ncbi:MAG: serine protease [Woeseiaceae bacterium]|nr:serine protease [Woeseiaceae bacterium]
MPSNDKKTVSLVLGSGGARGLTHIGVIRELEEQGYEIAAIVGCSIGALVGGVYAAGRLDDLEDWFSGITKLNILQLLDFSWGRRGLVKGDRIIDAMIDVVGDSKIEELSVPYTAIATDIGSGREVWLRSGQLFDAIRASISLPMFFTPFKYKGMQLIDGGVVNPVPIAPTFNDHTDITIAVNLGGQPSKEIEPANKGAKVPRESSTVSRWINGLVNDIHDSLTTKEDDEDWGAYDVANQAFDAMQATIARQKLASYPPDQVIEIPRNVCTTLEFDRAAELIELGRQKTRDHLSKLA